MSWAPERPGTITAVHPRSAAETAWLFADVMIGVAAGPVRVGIGAAATLARTLRPLTDLAARPPLVPERYQPGRLMHELADVGQGRRRSATQAALQLFRQVVPVVVTEILDQLDLTALIRDRVDLNMLVRRADVNALLARAEPDAMAVPEVPIQSTEADQAITAWVDRVFHPHQLPCGEGGPGRS